jgi:hypothetical protein
VIGGRDDEQRPDELTLGRHPVRDGLLLRDADPALSQLGALDEGVASTVQSVTRRDHSCTRPVIASWAAANTAVISAAADRNFKFSLPLAAQLG